MDLLAHLASNERCVGLLGWRAQADLRPLQHTKRAVRVSRNIGLRESLTGSQFWVSNVGDRFCASHGLSAGLGSPSCLGRLFRHGSSFLLFKHSPNLIYTTRGNLSATFFSRRLFLDTPELAYVYYELPFGQGKRFLKTGALGQIVGGWQIPGSRASTRPLSHTTNRVRYCQCWCREPRGSYLHRPACGPYVRQIVLTPSVSRCHPPAALVIPRGMSFSSLVQKTSICR